MTSAAPGLVRLVLRIGAGFGIFAALARLLFGQRIAAVMALTKIGLDAGDHSFADLVERIHLGDGSVITFSNL